MDYGAQYGTNYSGYGQAAYGGYGGSDGYGASGYGSGSYSGTNYNASYGDSAMHGSNYGTSQQGRSALITSATDGYSSQQQQRSLNVSSNPETKQPLISAEDASRLISAVSGISGDSGVDILKLLTTVLNSAGEIIAQQQQTDLKQKMRSEQFERPKAPPYSAPVRFQKPKPCEDEVPPSKVVHCRAVADGAREPDIVDALKKFGVIKAVTIMPKIRQALVEFEGLESAIACVTFAQSQAIILLGRQLFVAYSKSSSINRSFTGQAPPDHPKSCTLLFTVINALHPVNVDTLKKITAPHAEVQRIVFFHKNGVQAMVEFATVEDAQKVQRALNGCDIYTGCCTLKIDFAKAGRLNVHKNTEESYDIEIERHGGPVTHRSGSNASGQVHVTEDMVRDLIAAGGPVSSPAVYNILAKVLASSPGLAGAFGGQESREDFRFGLGSAKPFSSLAYPAIGQGAVGGEGCVLIIYGVDLEKFNCTSLFNLFCLYGNVVKVKVFVGKPGGMCMVQYTDNRSTNIAIQLLNNLTVFGGKLSLQVSKHPYIADGRDAKELADGSSACMSFLESKNNRFKMVPGGVDPFSRIQPPSKVIHYFNAPPNVTQERLIRMLKESGAEAPVNMTSFQKAEAKHSSGLFEFVDVKTAIEAIVMANHQVLHKDDSEQGQAFTLKLAFSSSSQINHSGTKDEAMS